MLFFAPFEKGTMMNRTTIFALLATGALAACNGGATNQASNPANEAAGNEAATPANAAADTAKPEAGPAADNASADAGGTTLDSAFIVGRWTDNGDCSAVTEFRSDGSFLFPWGDTGQWTLAGDQLTLSGNPSPYRVRVIDRDTIERTGAGGSPHRATRCA
jgi:hypothetical protein